MRKNQSGDAILLQPVGSGLPNLLGMAIVNACLMSIVFSFLLFGNLMGEAYAQGGEISTFPISAYVAAAALSVIPISVLMGRKGRQAGFAVGAVAGMFAGITILAATLYSSFYLVVLAGVFVGVLTAASVFLRFAAIEVSAPAQQGRSASIVLCGGIIAAAFANYLPAPVGDLMKVHIFQGLAVTVFALGTLALAACMLLQFKAPAPQANAGRDLAGFRLKVRALATRVSFLRAVLLSAVGYSVMILIMNSTPALLTTICKYPLSTAEATMSYHYLAMFIPFLFSGYILDRLGSNATILLGCLSYFCSTGLFFASYDEGFVATSLILLGLGWNFIFIGSTAAIVNSVPESLANASQTTSEFSTDALNFLASVTSGVFLKYFDFSVTLTLAVSLVTLMLAVWAVPTRDYLVKDAVS